MLNDKNVVVTGGTGSLGKVLVRRLLSGEMGTPRRVLVLSRDEAKQHEMRLRYQRGPQTATDEIIYRNFQRLLQFQIGDVRNLASVKTALRDAHVVFNAAALKQVPTCEYFPFEAVQTNVGGAQNIVQAISEGRFSVETVVGISTDKACKPVNVMGMTKAIQERVLIGASLACPDVRFICVRYGNVLASRGSVIPLFHQQIREGKEITITTPEMTRFLLSLDQAVDTVFAALRHGRPGEIYIPRVPSARVVDLATVLIGERNTPIRYIGIRPGEKIHEILVSEEEAYRTFEADNPGYYAITPMLPELNPNGTGRTPLSGEYSSAQDVMNVTQLTEVLRVNGLLLQDGVMPVYEF